MIREYNTYVGMDVHARSICAKAVNSETGECWSQTFTGEGLDEQVSEWILSLPGGMHACSAYESGPTGFHTARNFKNKGIRCIVMAVSSIGRSPKDKKQKNDKHDAKLVLSELTNLEKRYSEVWVPSEETEAARHLSRARYEAAEDLKRAKQRVESFLLVYEYVWNEVTPQGNRRDTWTKLYRKWLSSIDLKNSVANKTLKSLINMVDARQEELDELNKIEEELSYNDQFKPYIDALTLLEGVDTKCAMMFAEDIDDPTRFSGGRKVSATLGLIPAENSTGDDKNLGRITKSGHSRLRSLIIEGDAAISARHYYSKAPRKGASVSPEILRHARAINKRLKTRYDDLLSKGKQTKTARVAIAREKAQAMWALMMMVKSELDRAA